MAGNHSIKAKATSWPKDRIQKYNLAGQRYGRLKVTDRTHTEKGERYWVCECDCGNIIAAHAGRLKTGAKKSCGCLRRELGQEKAARNRLCRTSDLFNKRFGRAICISWQGFLKGQGSQWLCQCDCGNRFITSANRLASGMTTSCGCYQKERARDNAAKARKIKPYTNVPTLSKICEYCGQEFLTKRNARKCPGRCRNLAYKESEIGKTKARLNRERKGRQYYNENLKSQRSSALMRETLQKTIAIKTMLEERA